MKVRFAPSPTGWIHLGNAYIAFLNSLFAQSCFADFLLRIEDSDITRSTFEFSEQLQADLRWFGIRWNQGPYYQSQRLDIYQHYYQALQEQGNAYLCFCTPDELALSRKLQRSSGQPPRYAGTCRNLSSEQIKEKCAAGMMPTLRFKVPTGQMIRFVDFVRGIQEFSTDLIGDFIIRRADGTPSFFFCNAIDDALMHVTHVLRGEDHISNTPRQILILNALQLTSPSYGHIALIIDSDGTPLSKRQRSLSLNELRQHGYLPEALQNYLARLGHSYQDHHLLSFVQLAEKFSLSRLSKTAARFDMHQLLYWQKQAVLKLNDEQLWRWIDCDTSIIPEEKRDLFAQLMRENIEFPNQAQHWIEVFFTDQLKPDSDHEIYLKTISTQLWSTVLTAIDQYGTDFKAVTAHLKDTLKIGGVNLFKPLRLALTMQMHGPELEKIFILLGKKRIKQRLQSLL